MEDIKTQNDPFASGVRVMMVKKNIPLSKLATDSGMKTKDLGAMLLGRRIIRARHIKVLCEKLGCSIDEVFNAGE